MGAVSVLVTADYMGECFTCGVPMWVPGNRARACREEGKGWHCCNGHSQIFKETDVTRLEKQLANEKQRREWAEKNAQTARHAEAIARGKLKATKERIGNGVCPCCNRSFTNLRRHMASKHPGFAKEET